MAIYQVGDKVQYRNKEVEIIDILENENGTYYLISRVVEKWVKESDLSF